VTTSALTVTCQTAPPDDWDDYVSAHPQASVYHCARAVRIAEATFGLRCYVLTARGADGGLRGVLPLVEQRLVPWTRSLVSLPFVSYGGVVASSPDAVTGLLGAVERLAADRRADRIVIRQAGPVPEIRHPQSLDKVSMVMALPATVALLDKSLGSKLRSQVRRAERENPEVRIGGVELVPDFYGVFCSVMRDLGTPVYPRRFFSDVCAALEGRASVVVVYLGNSPVAGAVLVRWREGMEVPWAGTLARVKGLAINMRLYSELLRHAIGQGCQTFDFGRSTVDAGTYRFKSQWGAKPVQQHWYSWSAGAPDASGTHQDARSRLDLAVRLWQRMPLPVANLLGPRIAPNLPW
jgi:FemAB-related protein (PEP-CTERM system-associated)